MQKKVQPNNQNQNHKNSYLAVQESKHCLLAIQFPASIGLFSFVFTGLKSKGKEISAIGKNLTMRRGYLVPKSSSDTTC